MNERPTVPSDVVAEIMDAAPARVRKRLDRDPNAASTWTWSKHGEHWEVLAGDECVTLVVDEHAQLLRTEHANCTCLLAPKCFHLLACITSLAFANVAEIKDEPAETNIQTNSVSIDSVVVSEAMRDAASRTMTAVESVLTTGSRSSGTVIQSMLLRAAHQCRAEGMINVANATIRLAEGIRRLRARDQHTDSDQLRLDVVAATTNARFFLNNDTLSREAVGYQRRPYVPVSLSRIRGFLAEPIFTLSGYAGVCVHFEGDDGNLYQVADLRPGEASLIAQAYQGGIDLGATTVSARQLSRCRIDVQNLTTSPDGRLGKGTKTRWAVRTQASDAEQHSKRFSKPLAEQIKIVFENQSQMAQTARSGWDLVECEGTVIGTTGSVVLFAVDDMSEPIHLGIAIDDDRLEFRRNLQQISHCPGLLVRVLGRVHLGLAGRIDALSIKSTTNAPQQTMNDGQFQLVLPDSYQGQCHLGLDELQRSHLIRVDPASPKTVPAQDALLAQESSEHMVLAEADLFPGLTNRLIALVIGGKGAVASIGSSTHQRDHRRLSQRSQTSAAQLLDAIASVATAPLGGTNRSSITPQLAIMLAAANAYCKTAKTNHQLDLWKQLMLD